MRYPRLPEALRRFLLDRDDRKRLDLVSDEIVEVLSDVHYGFDFDPDQITLRVSISTPGA